MTSFSSQGRVYLVTPDLESSGGIGRYTQYLLHAWPTGHGTPGVRVLATRTRRGTARSTVSVVRSLLELSSASRRGECHSVHINLSSRGSTVRKSMFVVVCRLLDTPVILHLHGSQYREFFATMPRAIKRAIRWMFLSASHVIVLGETWRQFAVSELHVAPENVTVLPNAVPSSGQITDNLASERRGRLLFLGTMNKRKGLHDLLLALRDLEFESDWHLTIAGDGDIVEWSAKIDELGIHDRVTLAGWVSASEARALIAHSQLLVLPSHAEGMPMAILEAMAAKTAVIATPVGAIAEFVEDGRTGLIVPPGSPAALGLAIRRCLLDPDLTKAVADRAFEAWHSAHNMDDHVERLIRLHAEAAQEQTRASSGAGRHRTGRTKAS